MLLYAVLPRSPVALTLETKRLHFHTSGSLMVAVAQRDRAPERTMSEVLAFGRVLRRIWERSALLPIRFGTVVADFDELEQTIDEHRELWQARLEAVAGHSEFIVHVPAADDDRSSTGVVGSHSGRDYLARRALTLERHRSRVDELERRLEPYVDERALLPPGDGRRIAFLVRDEHVNDARAAIAAWSSDAGNEPAEVTGPWPPFSFCQEEGP